MINIIGEEKWSELRTRNEQEVLDTLQSRLTKFCDDVQAELPACPFIIDDIIVKIGHPVDEILLEVEDKGYDMVVMGAHGHSALANALMGSTSRRVVRRSKKTGFGGALTRRRLRQVKKQEVNIMLKPRDSYEAVYNTFKWKIPKYYNMGVDVCDKHAHQRYRLALIYENEEGRIEKYTFWQLKRLTNQFANALQAFGFGTGDRLGILLPQCPETGISHIAAYKIGGIAIPLFTLFGPEALEYRLSNSQAKRYCDRRCQSTQSPADPQKIFRIWKGFSWSGVERKSRVIDFWESIRKGSHDFKAAKTRADDPALLAYTSGTTGPPKGALHAHRMLLGHIPGVEFPHNFFPARR